MIQVTFQRNYAGYEDLLWGVGTVLQTRGVTHNVPVTRINASLIPFDATTTITDAVNDLQAQIDQLPIVVDQNGDMLTGLIDTSALDLSATHIVPSRLWNHEVNANLAEIYFGGILVLQYDPTNGNLITDQSAFIAADAVVTAAFQAADAAIIAAFAAADAQLTLDYIAADAVITVAFQTADALLQQQISDLGTSAQDANDALELNLQTQIDAISTTNSLIQSLYTSTTAATTIAATIPDDDTVPQVTEGGQVLVNTITPTNVLNRIRTTINIWGSKQDGVGADGVCCALFADGATNAIAAAGSRTGRAVDYNDGFTITLIHEFVAGTLDPITLSARAGAGQMGITINGRHPARKYGGVGRCSMIIEELAP